MAYIVSSGSDGVSDGGVHVVSDAAQLLDPVGSTAAVPNQLIGPIRTDKSSLFIIHIQKCCLWSNVQNMFDSHNFSLCMNVS